MKRNVISVVLIITLLVAALPLMATATDNTAKTITQAYKQLINSATLMKYMDSIAFCDLDGNTIPEMFLMVEKQKNTTLVDLQIWSYQDGNAVQIGSDTFGLAGGSSVSYYLNSNNRLTAYKHQSDNNGMGKWYGGLVVDTFDFNPNGSLTVIDSVDISWDVDGNYSGNVNGKTLSAWEAKQRYEAEKSEYQSAQIKIFDNGFSKKSDAISFLDGIDAFFDVPGGEYYSEPVKWAVENGITNGTGDYSFSPGLTCTRAQILTFLWRAAGSPVVSISNPFYDVSTGDYFYQAALWAYQNGMVSGTVFEGTTPCTRAATVTYIWQSKGSPSSAAASFTDVPAGSTYSPAVAWAVNNRITDGVGNNQFAPDMICSRGQIVTFLYRARNIAYSGTATEKPAGDSILGIESAYIPLLKEIQSVILTGNDHGLSENAQAYITCKQMDYGQGGSIDTTLFALVVGMAPKSYSFLVRNTIWTLYLLSRMVRCY